MQKTRNTIAWKAWGGTNPGKKRENNEDRIICDAERGIFVVVDGMGGEAAGEIAAEKAVDVIATRLHQETGTVARRLREAIAGANNEIFRLAERNPQWKGMACVLTAAVIEDGLLHIGHVGDSRLYRVHDSQIRKITSDHSPVGQKEEAGELTELEAMKHLRRNEVFRDVGSQPHKPDDPDFIQYVQLPFENNAAVILCSDGLSDMLTSREILDCVIENAGRPHDSVHRLIEKANAAGGKDNISAIVVEAENFASAGRGNADQKDETDGFGPTRSGSGLLQSLPLQGRWAFLCYGLLVGLLAAFLWHHFFAVSVPDQPGTDQSPPLPRLLRVEPASADYPTISMALEAARAGDRIEVGDGEYEESIRLKEGVNIAARSPGRAILRPARTQPGIDAAITADRIKQAGVVGLAVKPEPAAELPFGIRISSSNVDLSNIEVAGAIRAGILVDGNSSGTIIASYIHANSGAGILVAGDANPLLVGNVIYANGTSRSRKQPGMYVTGNANPDAKRNVFSGNGAEAIRLQRGSLKDRMMDNLFVGPGRPAKAVVVERIRQ